MECKTAFHIAVAMQHYQLCGAFIISSGRVTMKVVLASYYRPWMLALFPTTLGVGTLALWWRSLNWPLRIDSDGVTLRRHRRLLWNSINRIGVSRSYGDGHVSEMRIHHHGTVSRIPVHGLRDGDEVAAAIITNVQTSAGAGNWTHEESYAGRGRD